jgi:hypothetical protein
MNNNFGSDPLPTFALCKVICVAVGTFSFLRNFLILPFCLIWESKNAKCQPLLSCAFSFDGDFLLVGIKKIKNRKTCQADDLLLTEWKNTSKLV